MLNIPESVKALFLREGVRKNLRISSPSGAFADICNDRIVKESLKLRESVSSADSLAFGTAEGATLQFEAVGIPNLLGQDITAALEVDASTLPPELQTIKPDIPYPVFSVPMGVYRVTACPRDKNAVPHRKVTAQQRGNDAVDFLSDISRKIISDGVLTSMSGKVKYYVDPFDLLLSNGFLPLADYVEDTDSESGQIEFDDENYADSIGGRFFREASTEQPDAGIAAQANDTGVPIVPGGGEGGAPREFLNSFQLRGTEITYTFDPAALGKAMYSADAEIPVKSADALRAEAEAMAAEMYAAGYRFLADTQERVRELTQEQLADKLLILMRDRWPMLVQLTGTGKNRIPEEMARFWGLSASDIIPANIYPQSAVTSPNTYSCGIIFDCFAAVNWSIYSGTLRMIREMPQEPYPDPLLTVTSYSTASMGYRPTFTFSAETVENDPLGGFRHYWTAETVGGILLSALELMGGFGQIARDGSKYIKYLEPANPYPIGKEISETCWWDEYDLEPIGSIAYTFNGEDLLYSFGPGRSVYTITNQAILDRLTKYKQAQVEQFFEAQLVPRLASIRFTPMELVCRGLPFLEAGDCVAVEADDGTMVPTYVLERSFSGIQHLTDRITADGITIVEVEA